MRIMFYHLLVIPLAEISQEIVAWLVEMCFLQFVCPIDGPAIWDMFLWAKFHGDAFPETIQRCPRPPLLRSTERKRV